MCDPANDFAPDNEAKIAGILVCISRFLQHFAGAKEPPQREQGVFGVSLIGSAPFRPVARRKGILYGVSDGTRTHGLQSHNLTR